MRYATRAARALLGATAHPGGEALSLRAIGVSGLGGGDPVLDVGCGDGATLRLLHERRVRALGVDVEPDAVARCHGRAVVGHAQALPAGRRSVHAVLLECVLSTLPDPAQALREAARVLQDDGVLVVSDVVLDRGRATREVIEAVDRLTTARSVADWTALLTEAGFVVTVCEDRRDDALALTRRVRRRLTPFAPRLARTARACERAVREGSLGYVLLVAVKAGGKG